jgi:hypothetical protein
MDRDLKEIINNIDSIGEFFVEGKRNSIKIVDYQNKKISIKIFKVPSLISGFIYRYVRPSKAKRSFLYGKKLEACGIGTPKPIAYFENKTFFQLLDSYYICDHLQVDYVFKDLFNNDDNPELPIILKQLAKFTFSMHEKGIEFLDHSPGNTLIQKVSDSEYLFYLVDLNRMKFHKQMSFKTRMKNFARITPSKNMIYIMSEEYAKLINIEFDIVFDEMWKQVEKFQYKFHRKKRLKKKLMFWKK